MTMLSFRIEETDAARVGEWARRLGVDRSDLIREAIRRHLDRLASEHEARTWADPLSDEDGRALAEIADWGPAEDWSDWSDASG
jgi:Arc/MetJ-type ribon-helix-helix transcriptional regulator